MEKATFAAGCFWGVEEEYRRVEGVLATTVGYAGGTTENPTYEEVCTGRTGHAEAVEVEFDPSVVSYADLVEKFWTLHDPTQKDRQGPDVGTQYRSSVFFTSPEQESVARRSLEMLEASGRLSRPVATEILAAGTFWPAEDYHQQYLSKRGMGACSTTIRNG